MKPFVIGVARRIRLRKDHRRPADRGDLRLEERAALTYDHPDSLETDLLVRHPGTRVGSR